MSTNPLYNAILAAGYITLVVMIISSFEKSGGPDTILVPIAMLSLFVLSVSIMAYLFFYQPLMLYLAGQQDKAVHLFLKTLGFFALITLALFSLLFFVNNVA